MAILFFKFLLKNSTQGKNRVLQPMENFTRQKQKENSEMHSGGVNCLTIWAFFGFFQYSILKTPILCSYLHPLACVSKYCFCFHLVEISISYVVVYSIFSVGIFLEEKCVKQNGLFEEFLYSDVLVKYYRIQWLLFFKKPPFLAVSFKFMT